jgi:uncharacterized protein YjlB
MHEIETLIALKYKGMMEIPSTPKRSYEYFRNAETGQVLYAKIYDLKKLSDWTNLWHLENISFTEYRTHEYIILVRNDVL